MNEKMQNLPSGSLGDAVIKLYKVELNHGKTPYRNKQSKSPINCPLFSGSRDTLFRGFVVAWDHARGWDSSCLKTVS